MEKYGTEGQATDNNVMRHIYFACWVTKATDPHSEYVTAIAFSGKDWLRESFPTLYVRGLEF